MAFKELERALSGAPLDLKPTPIPDETLELEMVTLDRSETDNKMTPFFNVFLDDKFQSCHYGTELYL